MGKNYCHLSLGERIILQSKLELGQSLRMISAELGRSASTLSRELRRHSSSRYQADQAQSAASRKAAIARVERKLVPGSALWDDVLDHLRGGLSPPQIASTLKRMSPRLPATTISHETIYQAIYTMPRGDLRAEVLELLRHRRQKRRPRTRGKDRRGQIPNMISIHARPEEIEERLVPGHWEGDTIKGRYNRSAVGTLVERSTLFTVLIKLDGCGADAALEGFSRVLSGIDRQKRLSMTYDRGKEMARHEELTERTGVKVYFADPHAPWQRGTNENTNGLVRQYLPKKEDLSLYSQQQLDEFAWLLNQRPRKSLDWKCPAELFLPDFSYEEYYERVYRSRRSTVALGT